MIYSKQFVRFANVWVCGAPLEGYAKCVNARSSMLFLNVQVTLNRPKRVLPA